MAEGEESALKELVAAITARALDGGGAEIKANWQLPLGSYEATFPIVDLTPEKLSAVTGERSESPLE